MHRLTKIFDNISIGNDNQDYQEKKVTEIMPLNEPKKPGKVKLTSSQH